MGGETTRVENRGETTRGETTRGETSWGRNVLLPRGHSRQIEILEIDRRFSIKRFGLATL